MIYLDNAATTYPKPEEVYHAMDFLSKNLAFNSGRGGYKGATLSSSVIEDTRALIKSVFRADDEFITVLTPSATIALNQIIKSVKWNDGDIIYVSPYEHNSVARTINYVVESQAVCVKMIPLNEDFTVDLDQFRYLCVKDKPRMLILSVVSNVTGYILPHKELSKIAREVGTLVLFDASQAAGLVNIDAQEADFIVWAGHKTLYGPLGVGGYIVNRRGICEMTELYLHGGDWQ